MAVTCPTDFDRDALRAAVRDTYSRVATDPDGDFHFHRGAAYAAAGLATVVEVHEGDTESLPLPDASVDVVQSNGVLNLTPDKRRAFAEIARVLKPGGRLHLGDVVIDVELHEHERRDHGLWAACVGGAVLEEELATLAAGAGLTDARVVARHDAFGGTPVETKVADAVGVHGVTFFARKPL